MNDEHETYVTLPIRRNQMVVRKYVLTPWKLRLLEAVSHCSQRLAVFSVAKTSVRLQFLIPSTN